MKALLFALGCLVAASCSDYATPAKQCDPDRRCTSEDAPVCGEDGVWYECGLVADCEEVPVTLNVTVCGERRVPPDDPPDDPPECPAIACAECENLIEHFDDNGCLESCECGPTDCAPPPGRCEVIGEDERGCPICGTVCPDTGAASCEADPACRTVIGPDGCETCECTNDRCDRLFCDNFCPNGYLIVDGCPTCQCHEACAEGPECDLFCPTGNATDPATGCVTSCECLAEECSPPDCQIACQFGFRTAADGCSVCECAGPPCFGNEDCGLDQKCAGPVGDADGLGPGECVTLERCDADGECPNREHCGFYFRRDCCPPLTTCTDDLPSCSAVCLLELGAIR